MTNALKRNASIRIESTKVTVIKPSSGDEDSGLLSWLCIKSC